MNPNGILLQPKGAILRGGVMIPNGMLSPAEGRNTSRRRHESQRNFVLLPKVAVSSRGLMNPNGIPSHSPGLPPQGDYPGYTIKTNNPNGVAPSAIPFGLATILATR